MKKQFASSLLALGLLAGLALQAPAHAAGGLGPLTKGSIAPADISGAIVFGKNGEIVQLDAKGKPQQACALPQGEKNEKAKKSKLPECAAPVGSPKGAATGADGGVPCQGYYIVWVNGVPVKIWYPSGCTPPQ